MNCPECESPAVSTLWITQKFAYGTVLLEALVPVRRCAACGFEYLDEMSEDAREAAVTAYLHRQESDDDE